MYFGTTFKYLSNENRNHDHSAEGYSPLQAGEPGQDHGEAQREDGPRPVLPAQPRGGLHPLEVILFPV